MQINNILKNHTLSIFLTMIVFLLIFFAGYNLAVATNNKPEKILIEQPPQSIVSSEPAAPQKTEISKPVAVIQQPEAAQEAIVAEQNNSDTPATKQVVNVKRIIILVVVILAAFVIIGGGVFTVYRLIKKKNDANYGDEEQDNDQQQDISFFSRNKKRINQENVSVVVEETKDVVVSEFKPIKAETTIEAEPIDEVEALRLEVERLKQKSNQQLEYIESIKNTGAATVPNLEVSEDKGFFSILGNTFNYLEQKELVYKPQKQTANQCFTYVSSKDFFNYIALQLPDHHKKDILDLLNQFGIVDDKCYEISYKNKRVLKIYDEHFITLKEGRLESVGA